MACLQPVAVRTKKGNQVVPCGKCRKCLKLRKKEWTFRLAEEMKTAVNSFFVTLTYSDEHLLYGSTGDPILYKKDVQDFIKRYRHYQKKIGNRKMRYFAVGEYGGRFGRPHYHLLMFDVYPEVNDRISEIWNKGITQSLPTNIKMIKYTCNYLLKKTSKANPDVPEFSLMSRNPGIGHRYVEDYKDYHNEINSLKVLRTDGIQMAMPRYYRSRIFSSGKLKRLQEKGIAESLREQHRIDQKYDRRGRNRGKEEMEHLKIELEKFELQLQLEKF